MRTLKRYIKPYIGYVAAIIILLFCQSAVDLNLPNLMSDIVNTGIQQGGISEAAPKAVSAQTLDVMKQFMSDSDREIIENNYRKATEQTLSEKEWNSFRNKWPAAESEDVYCFLPQSQVEEKQSELAFGRSAYALMSFVNRMAESTGQKVLPGEADSAAEIGSEQLNQLLSVLKTVSREAVSEDIAAAAAAPEQMILKTSPVFIKNIYRQLGANTDGIQTGYILKVGGKMLLMTVLLVCFSISVGFCASRLGTGVARDLRLEVFERVMSFTTNEYDRFGTASLITRTTNDVMQIRGLLSMGLRTMFYAPIIGIGGTIMALGKSPSMAWIIALAGVLIFGIIMILFAIAMPRFKIMQKLVDKLNLVSRENLSGMMVIRAFATQKFEEERFAKANRDLANNNLFVFRAMSTMMPVMMLIMNGVSLLIVWVGGHQIAASSMQVGDMMAFIQYTMQIIMSFLMISMVFVMVPRAAVSVNRIAEILDCSSSVEDTSAPRHLTGRSRGVVEFHDVSFRYEGADENVLEHISFTARPGETTAFIGSTGSGKSTVVNLIPRFYDVTSGSITLDGVDIREIPQKELRDMIGYVPQKGVLFSGSIASNLRYGKADATDEEMRKAADIAQATEFIDEMKDGFSTPVSQGGTNVSGGQRQRLSIARALVKNAPVYIFDDTFSALDLKTDAKLRQALRSCTENATMLVVAQRVSTIMNAQQIVVLEDGKIVGIGTHRELLKTCRTYREIAESQMTKEELN